MAWTSHTDLDRYFRYHAPSPEDVAKLEAIRATAREFARLILDLTPACADQSAAIRHVRDAVASANAAIVIPRPERPA